MRDEYQPIRGRKMYRARKLYGGRGAFAEDGGMYSVILMGGIHHSMCGGRLDL